MLTGIGSLGDFLLPISKEEQLEPDWNVILCRDFHVFVPVAAPSKIHGAGQVVKSYERKGEKSSEVRQIRCGGMPCPNEVFVKKTECIHPPTKGS